MPFCFPQDTIIQQYCRVNTKYPPSAYYMLKYALDKANKYKPKFPYEHLSGAELSNIIRQVMLELYGPFAIDMLMSWNIYATADFGQLVYNLVDLKLLCTSENDSIHDFDDVYDFNEAFVKPFHKE